MLASGLVAVSGYHIAVGLFPARWGGPNIGGGLILLFGYLGVFMGLLRLTMAFREGKRRSR